MMKRIFPLFFIVLAWGCQKPNQPVPAAHTDTFIAYPAVADTIVAAPLADTMPVDSSGLQLDSLQQSR
jgi:hypothetical protein